jgi:hypothetical protein
VVGKLRQSRNFGSCHLAPDDHHRPPEQFLKKPDAMGRHQKARRRPGATTEEVVAKPLSKRATKKLGQNAKRTKLFESSSHRIALFLFADSA